MSATDPELDGPYTAWDQLRDQTLLRLSALVLRQALDTPEDTLRRAIDRVATELDRLVIRPGSDIEWHIVNRLRRARDSSDDDMRRAIDALAAQIEQEFDHGVIVGEEIEALINLYIDGDGEAGQ